MRFGTRRAARVLERNVLVYRRAWGVLLSGAFEPLFYLLSIEIGLGALVGDLTLRDGSVVSYAQFAAPALLASAAMNGPVFESFGIFFKVKYSKTYDGILATPVGARDIALGEITWSQIRGVLYAISFIVIMLILGLVRSPWAVLLLPGAMLIGLAFGAVGMFGATFLRNTQDFDLIGFVTMPMFLFSATFYPLSVYPEWLQTVARFSPLYHGVDLLRAFSLGLLDWSIAGHVAFLLVMVVVGLAGAARRVEKLLLS